MLSIQEHFQKYYDAVMPYLKAILMNATDKSNRMLRAKSMECISLVGMAVGKQKFKDDAKQVISVIVSYSIVHNSFLLQKHLKLNMLYFSLSY
jgi:importin-5